MLTWYMREKNLTWYMLGTVSTATQAGSMTLVTYLFHPIPLFLLHTYTTLMNDFAPGHVIPVMCTAIATVLTLCIPVVNRALAFIATPPVTEIGFMKED